LARKISAPVRLAPSSCAGEVSVEEHRARQVGAVELRASQMETSQVDFFAAVGGSARTPARSGQPGYQALV
jgi:hypothetical protein